MGLRSALGNAATKAAEDLSNPSWKTLLVTLPWLIGVIFCVCSCLSDQAIAKRQMTTNGIIRTHEPENHNRFGYEFSVDGKIFTGWESPATNFEIGQRVLVYYDPLEPEKNSLEDFSETADRAIGFGADLGIGVVAFAAYIFMRSVSSRGEAAKSRRQRQQQIPFGNDNKKSNGKRLARLSARYPDFSHRETVGHPPQFPGSHGVWCGFEKQKYRGPSPSAQDDGV